MKQHDFDQGVLEVVEHRPWPLPDGPWIMTQSWHDLLFAHWPLPPGALRDKVPEAYPIDTFDGHAWIGVIPFHMTNVAPRGIPALPWVSAFPELNVRTYVTVDGKPGVFFLSLDAGNPLAVRAARALFSLPYYSAVMDVGSKDGWIHYDSRRSEEPAAAFAGRYRPSGPARKPVRGTLEHFLTERYCLYTIDSEQRPYRLEIHHPPWPLQPAELDLSVNTMAQAAGVQLPDSGPLLHFSRRQDMVAWPLERLAR